MHTACFILFLTFLILKLTNVIMWSWWWVTAPLWIPLAISGCILVIILIIGIIGTILVSLKK